MRVEQLGDDVTLYCGDCLKVLPTLEAHSFDAIIADLPYGTTACKWDTVIPFVPLWENYKRLIKPKGAIVMFGSQPFTSLLVYSNLAWFKYEWIWHKTHAVGFLDSRRKPLKEHENVIVFADGQTTYNPQLFKKPTDKIRHNGRGSIAGVYRQDLAVESSRTIEWDMSYPRSVIRYSNQSFCDRGDHPTQKPVALLEYLIRTYTNEGDTVLDNVMGSGTTGVACVKTGRRFIGIEIDKGYFDIACRRIEAAQQQLRLPLE